MKKQLLKHFTQFTAALSLCAAILAGTPSADTSGSETGYGKPQIILDKPETGNISENDPGITPQDDLPPRKNRTD